MNRWLAQRYISVRKKFGDKRKWQLVRMYYLTRWRFPHFDNPTDISEYVMSNILYRRNDRFAPYADKLLVRDYVESKGLGHLLTELYGVWNDASQVDFDTLPERFVLKTNQGCGYNIICRDKSTLDRQEAREKLDNWLKHDYSWLETHYSLIEPKILAEEFIDNGTGEVPTDYKIMCVRGEPQFVMFWKWVGGEDKYYVFTNEWECDPEYYAEYYDDWKSIRKPENLDKMLEYARILSKDFDFVRVDLYDTGLKVYFSELTFSPACGHLDSYTDKAIREMYAKLKGV